MILIPIWVIIVLGITSCAKEIYAVFFLKKFKNAGSLFALLYITTVYTILLLPDVPHMQPYVRVGVMLILLDKSILFLDELIKKIKEYRNGDR